MSFVGSIAGYFFVSAGVGFLLPFLGALAFQRESWRTVGPLLLALALVGACAGFAGGMSRASAVGDVIPAFLGLLGVVGVYLFGVDQSRGIIASFGAAALSIALLIGYASGSQYRAKPEDHRDIRAHCARAYTDADLLGNEAAFERFRQQMGNLCDASMFWRVTTSEKEEQ
ncbi:hypothetical protein FIU86_21350 (plasmid) [Roseovarius sp. THAF9]|uniref:hypothetical protein n=2 Tax=Rhodobacterales TaxID=204455 RepID=UPI0012687D22|nr:hypothetical protein [Roseovarius sp. THAF9]QFT95413.1 hypothetical protein FIU86_21350 [Roseovarius sp. THAF9]